MATVDYGQLNEATSYDMSNRIRSTLAKDTVRLPISVACVLQIRANKGS